MRIKVIYYFGLLFLFFIFLGTLNAMETDLEEEFHWTHQKSEPEYDRLGLAAGKGDQSAFDILMREADQKNPNAIFELGKVFIDRGDNLRAAHYLKMSTNFPELCLHPRLTKGFILHLQGDFSGAIKYYRSVEKENPDVAYPYKYGNSDFLIQCIKSKLYNATELKIAVDQLIEFAKSDKDLRENLKGLSKENDSFYAAYMAVVAKPATRKSKKDSLIREREIPVLRRQDNSLSLIHKSNKEAVLPKQKAYSVDSVIKE